MLLQIDLINHSQEIIDNKENLKEDHIEGKIIEASRNNENVIIDMTNLSSKRRARNLGYFSRKYYKIGIVFPILEDKEYILRNSVRSKLEGKDISLSIIKNMIKYYKSVSLSEGFNKLVYLS